MTVFKKKGQVKLRPMEKDDAEFLRDLMIHPDVRNTIGRPPKPANIEEEKKWVQESRNDEDAAHFIIEYRGEKAGTISIHGINGQYRRGEFGISIHPDHHNKGVGTKSVQMITEYAFETLNLHKVRGGYLEHNPPSKRVMEKAGFQEEGRERDYKYVDGEWKDVIWMGILEHEYFDQK